MPHGGFPTIHHNEIHDITATLLTEVCNNVTTEPPFQPLSGKSMTARSTNTTNGAHVDIRARGFWNMSQDAFFDVRVFYPNTSSNSLTDLSSVYRKHEQAKKCKYGQQIEEVERGIFTLSFLQPVEWEGQQWPTCRYDLSEKATSPNCNGWLRPLLQGSWSSLHRPIYSSDITLATSEGRVPPA